MAKPKPADQLPSPSPVIHDVTADPPLSPPLGILAHYSSLPATEGAGIRTTLSLATVHGVMALQHILAGGAKSLWDLPPEQLVPIEHVTAHYACRIDEETGVLSEGPMITLSGPDGVYHTGSQYAFRALQLIAILRGPPPWSPPILIRAVRVRSRNKREFQSLLLS